MTGGLRPGHASDIIASMPLGVITMEPSGLIGFANSAAGSILDWDAPELVGRNFHETAHYRRPDGTAYPFALCPHAAVLRDRKPRTLDRETLWRRDGTAVVCDVTASPLVGGGLTITLRDASARLELARAQEEFVGMVSHELRTPLASLLGALTLIDVEGVGADQRESLIGIAQRNAKRLARLVDDILDLEKVRAGGVFLAREEMTARSLSESATDAVAGTAIAHDVSLAIDADDSSFWADRLRLEQVLTNLLDNAIKHSPTGGTVTLRIRATSDSVLMDVIDQGKGLGPDDLKRVFDRFWQEDSSNKRARQGSGLGLTISQAIMELHGGAITGSSEVGKGMCFTVRLPVRAHSLKVPVDLRSLKGDAPDATNPAH
ncbi:MAG: PAS domain-containing protein [Demequinaceae bacterium]|nr:PAS domain-containing protein [Demequinaceae bacterium]